MKYNISYFILFLSFLLLHFNSCNTSDSTVDNNVLKNSEFEEDVDSYNPILNEEWIKNNTPKKNANLIEFKYKIGNQNDYEKYRTTLLRPYEKNPNKVNHSDIEIIEHKDSIVISFWQNRILEGCVFEGNIELKKDTLKLIFEKICSPYTEYTDGEIVTLFHKYIIKSEALREIIVTEKRKIE